MFLHLGDNYMIPIKSIIGIFDRENASFCSDTISFLKCAEEEEFVVRINEEVPKSFVIAEIDDQYKVFLSPISSITLNKRMNNLYHC